MSDTIKRRQESPSSVPDLVQTTKENKSKIPLALKSPVPIRRSLSKDDKKTENVLPPSEQIKEHDKPENKVTEKETQESHEIADTFNLSEDSALFSKISENTLVVKAPREVKPKKQDFCHMVEVKESEIFKSSINSGEPMEVYPSASVETAMHYGPSSVERVQIIDTETESPPNSDSEEQQSSGDASQEGLSEWAVQQMTKLDSTFVKLDSTMSPASSPKEDGHKSFFVEVSRAEEVSRPIIGILKRSRSSNDTENDMDVKVLKPNQIRETPLKVVTVLESETHRSDYSRSNGARLPSTPPSTPSVDSVDVPFDENPLLADLQNMLTQLENEENGPCLKDKGAVAEYLILDERESVAVKHGSVDKPSINVASNEKAYETTVKTTVTTKRTAGISIGGSVTSRISRKSSGIGSSITTEDETESFDGSDKESDEAVVFSDDEEDEQVLPIQYKISPQVTPRSPKKFSSILDKVYYVLSK